MDSPSIDPGTWPHPSLAVPTEGRLGLPLAVLESSAALQQIVADLVADLAEDARGRLRLLVHDALAKICRVLGAEAATFYEIDAVRNEAVLSHDWRAATANPLADGGRRTDLATFPVSPVELLRHGAGLQLSPAAARWFKAGSSVAVPVLIDSDVRAVLFVHWESPGADWPLPIHNVARVFAHLVEAVEIRHRLLDRPNLDEDTGVANRKMALLVLGQSLARVDSHRSRGLAVLQCELTGLLHPATLDRWTIDQVLIQAARVLRRAIGDADVVARFAPATYVAVCSGIANAATAVEMAKRARADLQACFVDLALRSSPIGWTQLVDARFGVAYTGTALTPGVLLRQADTAACQAVASAGDGVILADG